MGFIISRSILHGVVLTKETIHQVRKKRGQSYILKLDFEKAYDTVNCECLLEAMEYGIWTKVVRMDSCLVPLC